MKTFEHFVTREFAGSDDLDDAIMALNEYANDGLHEKIIEKFTKAAELYKDQHIDFLVSQDAEKLEYLKGLSDAYKERCRYLLSRVEKSNPELYTELISEEF